MRGRRCRDFETGVCRSRVRPGARTARSPRAGMFTVVMLRLKHAAYESCSVHGSIKIKVWPFATESVIPSTDIRWRRTMLTSLRTVREISRSSILVEQGRLIANPNWPLKKSNSESHTLRRIWRPWMSFRLGWLISSLWVCLRRKYRMAARVAGPVVILCASRLGSPRLLVQSG